MIASTAMTLAVLISIGFIAGVIVVAVWASRRPTEQSMLVERLTQARERQMRHKDFIRVGSTQPVEIWGG